MTYSRTDLEIIRKIALNEKCFSLLVASLCPDIYGHEIVKAGLLLGLLGGNSVSSESSAAGDDEQVPIRQDIHVLIVGDPGLGKVSLYFT
jgi:DNA helicase MCM8